MARIRNEDIRGTGQDGLDVSRGQTGKRRRKEEMHDVMEVMESIDVRQELVEDMVRWKQMIGKF